MKSTNFFSVIAAELRPKAAALVRRSAIDVVFRCRAHSRYDSSPGREDDPTPHMRDEWTYEIEPGESAIVSNASDHVLANEYGNVNMTAQPMLHPAMDEARPDFEAGLAKLLEL